MRTPWHLWAIGLLSLFWNAGGAYDFVMSQSGNEAYLGVMTKDQRAWFENFPAWALVFWALGVWGALLGSVFLLLRTRLAVLAFGLSLIGVLANTTRTFSLLGAGAVELMGQGALIFTAAIIVLALLLWLYARAMNRAGVLR